MTTTKQTHETLTVAQAAINGQHLTVDDVLLFADELRDTPDMPGDGRIVLMGDPQTGQPNVISAVAQRLITPVEPKDEHGTVEVLSDHEREEALDIHLSRPEPTEIEIDDLADAAGHNPDAL